jgi:soluble lytic murein transglycosylase-like protein
LLLATSEWAANVPADPAGGSPSSSASAWLAILDNGFSIRHYRRESHGTQVRLYVAPSGNNFVDVPAASIVKVQSDEAPASVPHGASVPHATEESRAKQSGPWDDHSLEALIQQASDRQGIDPDLIRSVIAAESGFQLEAVSPKGAKGLMQLMPETASELGVENVLDPEANVAGGTRYLRELLVLYKGDLIKALAAYNAGPERVEQYNGVPPFAETRAYVSRVIREFNRKKLAQRSLKPGRSQ